MSQWKIMVPCRLLTLMTVHTPAPIASQASTLSVQSWNCRKGSNYPILLFQRLLGFFFLFFHPRLHSGQGNDRDGDKPCAR